MRINSLLLLFAACVFSQSVLAAGSSNDSQPVLIEMPADSHLDANGEQ